MSVSIMREPLREYLATNMPETYWQASSNPSRVKLLKMGTQKDALSY